MRGSKNQDKLSLSLSHILCFSMGINLSYKLESHQCFASEKSYRTERLPPCTGRILTTCPVSQDASTPAQFERARSGDRDQGEPTVLKWPFKSVLVGQNYFIATLRAVFGSKLMG